MPSVRAVARRLFPFVRSNQPLEQEHIERILLVGSGSRLNIERAMESMAARFPSAWITLLARPEEQRYNHPRLERVMRYRGFASTGSIWRGRRGVPFDLKVVLFTGEGQTLLKWQAFLFQARRMLAFTEGGGAFAWSFDERLAIWNHARWRFGGGRPLVETLLRLVQSLLMALLSLVGFLLLLLWHARLVIHRLMWRGDRSWPIP